MAVKCNDNPYADKPVFNINTPDMEVNEICDRFISESGIDVTTATGYNTMLRYISQNIKHIDNADIDTFDYYFNIYTYIAAQCKILPDITAFCVMVDLSYDTVNDWLSGQVRSSTHSQTAKKWRAFCKASCVSSAATGNVGAIYVSKAIHGLSDAPAPAAYTQNNIYLRAPTSRAEIQAEISGLLSDNSTELNPENELK